MFKRAKELLKGFKGENYTFGYDVLNRTGSLATQIGKSAILVCSRFPGVEEYIDTIKKSLAKENMNLIKVIPGAKPNCPLEDLKRITDEIISTQPDMIISFSSGSTIDACKAAEVLRTLGGDIQDYFGTGLVSQALEKSGKKLHPHIAIQTAASSGAHLTKYSNITDLSTGQKKLIVDDAIIPQYPFFDYAVTKNAPITLSSDGALDGISHIVEVLIGLEGKDQFPLMKEVAEVGIGLVLEYLPVLFKDPHDAKAREALCLATDLGGYAIMIGGTNGGHLTSFSLVDVLSHGRACAIMNPYYIAFFAPAIPESIELLWKLYKDAGYIDKVETDTLQKGKQIAEAMFSFARKIDFPTALQTVDGFSDEHIKRALSAAKNPQLKMKLENMPIPLTAETVDTYMAPILNAAKLGDISMIKYFNKAV